MLFRSNAGGVITRSVMGNPDNANNYFKTNNTYATPPVANDLFATYDYLDSMRRGYNEGQPDMYYYNFGGASGKFFLKTDQSVVKKEKNNLKITGSNIPTDATGSSSFTIVDENGTTYQFAATEMSFMQLDDGYITDQPAAINYLYPSSWYLTSITSADGIEQILFNYYTADTAQTQYANYIQNNSYTYSHSSLNQPFLNYETFVSNNIITPPTVSITKRKYLQSIAYYKSATNVDRRAHV